MDYSDDSDTLEADGCIVSKTINYINIERVDNLQSGSSSNSPISPVSLSALEQTTTLSPVPPLSAPDKSKAVSPLIKLSRKIFGDTTHGLKRKLKSFYSEATLPNVSWLDEGQDLLMSDYYVKLQLDNNSTPIMLEDIFTTTSGSKANRILIEGQPGYGKTTLATKIIFDWASSQKYLSSFKLAFLLPLRELRQRRVLSALSDIARLSGFSKYACTEKIIDDNISRTLLILDGLDELPIKERIEVLQILFKQMYSQVTVVVTCRTGLFNMDQCELRELFGGISKKRVFHDKRIIVVGVGIEDQEKFLSKFISQQNAKTVLKNLQELTVTIRDIFQSPLFLILLSMFVVKKKELLNLTTQTTFYKTLVNSIIRHSVGKKGVALNEKFDIFDESYLQGSMDIYRNAFFNFGVICLEKVMTSDLQFECNDLTTLIYEMGFLVNHKNVTFFESNQHFEAFHLSIVEFASAFALYSEINNIGDSVDQRTIQKIIEKITTVYCQISSTSLILPFLFGLLGKKSVILLELLEPIAHLSSVTEQTFWSMLAECTIDANFLSAIKPYVPPQICHKESIVPTIFQSPAHEDVLRQGIISKQIVSIGTNTRCPSRLPTDVVIPHLSLTVHLEDCLKNYNDSQLKNLRCEEVSFVVQNLFDFKDDALFCDYISLLCTIPAKKRSLSLSWCYNDTVLLKNINSTILQQLKLNHFVIGLNKFNSTSKELLFILLRRNQIKSLELIITRDSADDFSHDNFTEIIQNLANSDYLENLNIETMPSFLFTIDLHLLTNGGQKKWINLILRFLHIQCSKPITKSNCIEGLITKTHNVKTATASVSDLKLQLLEINSVVLYKITNNMASSWQSFDTLIELIILMDNTSNHNDFWQALTNLKKLKLLELIIPVRGRLTEIPLDKVVSCLQEIPIERFVLWRACRPYELEFTRKLIQQLATSFPWRLDSKPHPLSNLDLGFMLTTEQIEDSDLYLCLNKALESVKLGYLQNLNIISTNTSLWYLVMQNKVIDHGVFKVRHCIPGMHKNDPAYYKTCNDSFSSQNRNQFSISLI